MEERLILVVSLVPQAGHDLPLVSALIERIPADRLLLGASMAAALCV